jgi:beta-RFAP synthase
MGVRVVAPGRLHLGFLDLAGGLGRRFGSLGLAVEDIATVVTLRRAGGAAVDGPEALRAGRHLTVLCEAWGVREPPALRIERAIPPHAGLGSGTQLGLAVGLGLARLLGRDETPAEVAMLLDRGARSGIGVGAFAQGGFLVDGGKAEDDAAPPPVIVRLPFPPDWRLLLIHDPAALGVHGRAETAAFRALAPFPAERSAHLCRLLLMRLLPALATAELAPAADALAEIQRAMGDHFAPFQGGHRFASPAVGEAAAWLAAKGLTGIGQSSWGPTGFALVPDEEQAQRLVEAATARFPMLGFRAVAARNRPGEIETIGSPQAYLDTNEEDVGEMQDGSVQAEGGSDHADSATTARA